MAMYHSTRSQEPALNSKQAIRTGIAPDGGLCVCDDLGTATLDLSELASKSYADIARDVLGTLLTDYSAAEIAACVEEAYGDTFASGEVTPLVELAGELGEDCETCGDAGPATYVLELWHGPTSAFKDVALQMLPRLMARTANDGACSADASSPCGAAANPCAAADEKIMIVTATSGDTGKAALAGFSDAPGTGITVFYPEGKVSRVQELQMSTQEGGNVHVCGIRGNFDDAQSAVKQIFANKELAERLGEQGVRLSSANSINVGRLVPQVAYYFAAYAQLLRAERIQPGDAVEFCVPTGNFGDILAGYYAKRLGLPVAKLIVASDKNNVLCDFLTTGTYDRNRPFFTTTSPSMDILISSNLERMLYYLSDGDCELVAQLMDELAASGSYTLPADLLARIQELFGCGWADEDQVADAIATCWDLNDYLIDPHTACGYHVLGELAPAPDAKARVLLSTANPYKFPRAVADALGLACPEDDFACMEVLSDATGTEAPEQLATLQDKPILHTDVVDVDGMAAHVEAAALAL
ncbi:MAG: threonine synthase [Coriobacteriaceae bacterium]|nr:threonine synthase [Coriobacteriaceae bacterium]